MTTFQDNRTFSQRYLKLKCTCGRRLRVSVERLGSTVRCWDCRGPVPVAVPSAPGQTARVFHVGLREVLGVRGLLGITVGAWLFTAALLLPVPEPVVAALVLAAMAFSYAELVRRWGQAGALGDGPRSIGLRAYAARAAATLAVALILTNTWEFGRNWLGFTSGPFRETLVATAALAVVFPLAMLAVWAAPRPQQSLLAIARHPVATALALMVIPLGLVAAEALIVLLMSLQGLLGFYVVNLMPGSVDLAPRYSLAPGGFHSLLCITEHSHLALYFHQLTRGVAFSTELPASLMNPTSLYELPWYVDISRFDYWLLRAVPTAMIAAVWLAALTVQARCLGLLARLSEWQKPRAAVVVEPAHDESELEMELDAEPTVGSDDTEDEPAEAAAEPEATTRVEVAAAR